MILRNHRSDPLECLNFTNSLIIPVDLEGFIVIMDEKGSLGANHEGVCMVVKLRTAFSLASRRRECTHPGRSYGRYDLRGCDPPGSSRTTARHQSHVAELPE